VLLRGEPLVEPLADGEAAGEGQARAQTASGLLDGRQRGLLGCDLLQHGHEALKAVGVVLVRQGEQGTDVIEGRLSVLQDS
jgi:hypothetical protein